MRHKITGFLVGAAGLASAAFFALSGASCTQPAIQCVVAHAQLASFYAKYELVGGDADCYGLGGENIAMSTFLQPTADGKFADYNNRQIAIKSETMGSIFAGRKGKGNDEADVPYALGAYTTDPDANNICYAGGAGGTAALAAADLNIDAFDVVDPDTGMVTETLPAEHYRQEWKNVRVYVTAGVPGTQAVGEMHFEDVTNGCSADYKWVALFPSVGCGKDVDDDNDPMTDAANDDADPDNDDPQVADQDACLPKADPDKGRVFGSGINPDFKVTCDAVLLHCVLTEPPLTGAP